MVEARRQLGENRRAFSGANRLEATVQCGGVEDLHWCLSALREQNVEGKLKYICWFKNKQTIAERFNGVYL